MKVFYRPEQVASNASSFSPSASKPALVVEDWLHRGLIGPEDVMSFDPVTPKEMALAHDPDFVEGVQSLEMDNGFYNRDAGVAASLPFTSGSMLAAARYALAHDENVCSPTSGFHHAGYDFTGGYCTFNGLMITAMALLNSGEVNNIGIIDCDAHYGNGTDDIIRRLKVKGVHHHTMGKFFHDRLDAGPKGQRFLDWLSKAIDDCQQVDLLIYQAGADPHLKDPLGGILSEVTMAQRDHAVFEAFKGRPLVWNLAGGYQRDKRGGIEPVLRLHRHTMKAQNFQMATPQNFIPSLHKLSLIDDQNNEE
jgi:acetoin utilization deacetylase AcuC-like enzyme